MTVRLTQKEWARLIEQRMKKYELEQKTSKKNRWHTLKKYISIQIIIGLSCIAIYLALFGWEWMMKGILNGLMSATLIATVLTYINAR